MSIEQLSKFVQDLTCDKHLTNAFERLETWRTTEHDGTCVDLELESDASHLYRERDPDEVVLRIVKLDAPTFNWTIGPKVFTDWLSDMDH